MTRRLRLLLLLTPLTAAPALPAAADAGIYKVYSCKTPSARVAPTNGWTYFQKGGTFSAPSDDCAMGGALEATLNGDFEQPAGVFVGLQYNVPEGLELAGFRMWRYFSTTSASEVNATPAAFAAWPTPEFSPNARGECVAGRGCQELGSPNTSRLHPDDVVTYDDIGRDVRDAFFLAGCNGSSPCVDRNSAVPMARVAIKAFEARIRDNSAPTVSNVQSTINPDTVHGGTQAVSFSATDAGSGVYRVIAEIRRDGTGDWQEVSAQTVDSNNQRCADVEPQNADPYEFFYIQPCATETGGSFDIDTTVIPNGGHQLRILVEDAAGNRSVVLGPLVFRVTNDSTTLSSLGTPDNGVGASNQARITLSNRTRRAAKRLRYGQRYRLIATIRNENGQPVSGASVDILQRIKLPEGRFRMARKPVVTGRRGQVRWTVPAGPSRRLQLAYKANLLNGTYQAVTEIPLEVSAKTTLKRNRRSYRNGQTIRFRGQVKAKPIPKGGVLIDLQAYKRGTGWVTFATKRSGRRGKWRINYKLVSTRATVRYKFRARVRQDTGYPYSAGRTKSMAVLVRP